MSPAGAIAPTLTRLLPVPPVEAAKHRARARRNLRRLVLTWCATGRWHYPALLLSRTGYLLAREKYSAFAIDRVYANTPHGWGWLGRRLDRYLLDLPVHLAVRARFEFVVRTATERLGRRLAVDGGRAAVLSVPCGLARDLGAIHAGLRRHRPDVAGRLVLYGLDLDFEGTVLDAARQRARDARLPVHLIQANALDEGCWAWLVEREAAFTAIHCIGLAPWLAPDELSALLARFARHLEPTGYVLMDRWNEGRHARWGTAAEIHAHYHTDAEYREHVAASGLVVLKAETLGDHEGTGYVLQKRPDTPPVLGVVEGRLPTLEMEVPRRLRVVDEHAVRIRGSEG